MIFIIRLIFSLLVLPGLALSSEGVADKTNSVQSKKDVEYRWYKPTHKRSGNKKRALVGISGIAPPGIVGFSYNPNKILLFPLNNEKTLNARRLKYGKKNSATKKTVRKDGFFETTILLPTQRKALIPLKFERESGEDDEFLISLVLTEDKVQSNAPKAIRSPYEEKDHNLSLGWGANYLQYDQHVNESSADVKFDSFKLSSVYLSYEYFGFSGWRLMFDGKYSPGKVENLSKDSEKSIQYSWTTYRLVGNYFPNYFRVQMKDYILKGYLRAGIQHHVVPFLSRISSTEFDLTSNTVTSLQAGGGAIFGEKRPVVYGVGMDIQYPITSGANFDMESNLAFNGEISATWTYRHDLYWSIFWYGQMHSFDFTELTRDNSGNQKQIFSTMELRATYRF